MKIESLEFADLNNMATITKESLDTKLMNGACSISFVRKNPSKGRSPVRQMWCTKDFGILNSVNGRTNLNYRPPRHAKQINENVHNVLIVWDIFMQNYRTINMDQCTLVEEVPGDVFWEYFNENLFNLTAEDKSAFMG